MSYIISIQLSSRTFSLFDKEIESRKDAVLEPQKSFQLVKKLLQMHEKLNQGLS